ncbi:energy-coupling factor transporter transmembrane component T family protein [Mariniluteicoccus flavus]
MTRLDRLNPVTRILLAVVLSFPLILTLDWLSSAVMLGLVVVAALLLGFRPAQLVRRLVPLVLVGALAAISMALYGEPGGRDWFAWLLVHVTDNSLLLAAAVWLRMLALGLSAILLLGDVDPTDMADGLAQVLRLPARFVLGALAGIRMVHLFADDWRTLALARRARGLGDTGRVRRWLSMAFALLVLAVRRGSRLATAMEARGFGATGPDAPVRTWARPSRFHAVDAVALAVATVMVAVAIGAAVAYGTFFWVGS